MRILRTDGEFTVYVFQHQWEPDGPWTFVEGSFLEKFTNEELEEYPTLKDFTVHGECWRRTGLHGCFVYENALEALTRIVKKNPGLKFRIVEIHTIQEISPKHEMCEGTQVKGGVAHQMEIGLQHAPE